MCRPTRTYGRHILLARHLRNVSVDTPSIRATCVAVISSGTSIPERMRPGTVRSGNDHTGPAFPGMARAKVERTMIIFGKNAINQAYTLIGNFTDATMIMTAREDQLIDVVIGATFNDLQDTNSSPQSGKTITNIEGCKAADSMTKLPADTKHDAYTAQ